MKFFYTTIFILISWSLIAQITPSDKGLKIEDFIDQKDTLKIISVHPKVDIGFPADWQLTKAKKRVEIGHYLFGYNFEWKKHSNDTVYLRSFNFDLDGDFAYSHEQRFKNDTLISQGGLNFENDQLKYIRQAFPKKETLKLDLYGYWDYDVDYYEYEFYKDGRLISIYRTKHLNHLYMLTEEKNKDKVELVYGIDNLNVKK